MTERGFRRSLETVTITQRDLRLASAATGTTMNDVFVAGVVPGLRRYHDLNGATVDRLRALMPVSVRSGDHAMAGNHFVPARFLVPTPLEADSCVAQVSKITNSWKHAPALGLSDILATGLNGLPPQAVSLLWDSILKGDDFCITNVPGPPAAVYVAGALVERIFAFAPPSGAALNVALVTYNGHGCLGINVDSAAVSDSAQLASCLADGLDDVLELGRTGVTRRSGLDTISGRDQML